ncbi:MAG: Acinetobacter phage [Pseudomonadota bacterium]|jgi:molybdopterin-guanine dinucleotide biosynthesis protein A
MEEVEKSKSKKFVKVVCRLPNGFILKGPLSGIVQAINGANKDPRVNTRVAILSGDFYGETQVSSDLWEEWITAHKDHPAVVNRSIFIAGNEQSAKSMVSELSNVKTGFEGAAQDYAGVAKAA